MGEIKWTVKADRWLKDIYDHVALDNSDAAVKVITGIYEKVQILKDLPKIGYKYRAEPEGDIRILLYGHYRIAYLIKKGKDIDVLGVFHGALDIDKYLT